MDITLVGAGISWAWEKLQPGIIKYSEKAAAKGIEKGAVALKKKAREQWQKFNYKKAERAYKLHLLKTISKTKILGNPRSIEIESIYTDEVILS
jgi:hypothetical protein